MQIRCVQTNLLSYRYARAFRIQSFERVEHIRSQVALGNFEAIEYDIRLFDEVVNTALERLHETSEKSVRGVFDSLEEKRRKNTFRKNTMISHK